MHGLFRTYPRVRAQYVCISWEADGRGGTDGDNDELPVLLAVVSSTWPPVDDELGARIQLRGCVLSSPT